MQGSSIAESIGHEIKAIDHLMQRKMIMTASRSGLDKVTIMHGWIIGYLILNLDRDIYQKDIESEFAISRSTVTNILKLMEKKGYITKNGQVRLTAEILYQFISGEEDFIEQHQGLEDVLIEKEIFQYCIRQHKKMKRSPWKEED